MVDFTIAVPTYNGAKRLPKLLDRLRSQTGTEHFSWAILIVDNNSKDNTAAIVQHYQTNWSVPFTLDYAFEPQQGAAYARQKAIQLAQSDLIGCIDDDNLPDSSWVANAFAFGQKHPTAGAYGGKVKGTLAGKEPLNFTDIESVLALRDRGDTPHKYSPQILDLPPAAAVVIRKSAWTETVPSRPLLGGRGQGSMMQGDDYEPLMYMHKAGWEIWYAPALVTHHQIPQKRLERNYLLKLSWGCGLCSCHLRMINARGWQKLALIGRILLGSDLRILIDHFLKHGSQLRTELVPACQMAIYLANWLSPFYFMRDWLKQKFKFSSGPASQNAQLQNAQSYSL